MNRATALNVVLLGVNTVIMTALLAAFGHPMGGFATVFVALLLVVPWRIGNHIFTLFGSAVNDEGNVYSLLSFYQKGKNAYSFISFYQRGENTIAIFGAGYQRAAYAVVVAGVSLFQSANHAIIIAGVALEQRAEFYALVCMGLAISQEAAYLTQIALGLALYQKITNPAEHSRLFAVCSKLGREKD